MHNYTGEKTSKQSEFTARDDLALSHARVQLYTGDGAKSPQEWCVPVNPVENRPYWDVATIRVRKDGAVQVDVANVLLEERPPKPVPLGASRRALRTPLASGRSPRGVQRTALAKPMADEDSIASSRTSDRDPGRL